MSTKLPNVATTYEQTAGEASRMTGEERRRQLIQVAMRLFSQKGFTGTTTKEIAAAANVNEAIIFRHFATKDDLYAAILDYKANEGCGGEWLEDLRAHAERRDDEALFRTVAENIFAHSRHDPGYDFFRLMLYSALEGHMLAHVFLERQARPVQEFLINYVETRQREGAFRDVHPRLAVSAFIGGIRNHLMMNAFFEKWRFDITDEEAVGHFTDLLLGGLRAPCETGQPRCANVAPLAPETTRKAKAPRPPATGELAADKTTKRKTPISKPAGHTTISRGKTRT